MEETTSPTAVLQDLKDLGVGLMLDDFGTGYSSLNHVKRFSIGAIKVDRAFTAGVAEDEGDRHILRAIVNMAQALDVQVIAEGVESAEQAQWPHHLGIGLAQGYALGRPAPANAVEALLREGLALDRLAPAFEPLDPALAIEAAPVQRPGATDSQPQPGPAPGATVTLGEAAEALGLSTSSLRRRADTGRISAVRTAGGTGAFPRRRSAGQRGVRGRPTPRRSPAARSAHYDAALEATHCLVTQADYAGATLLERHSLLERYGDIVVRGLQDRGAPRAELVGARRLFSRLRQVLLETADARRAP